MNEESATLSILNRFLSSKKLIESIPPSLFKDLSGKIVKIKIDDLSYKIFLKFSEDSIVLLESSNDYDVEIKSSLANYLLFIISRGSSSYSSKIKINGDVDTASNFNSIMSDSKSIKEFIGNLIGIKKYVFIEKIFTFFADGAGTLSSDLESSVRDYIIYDLNLIPTKDEIQTYLDEVDDLNSRTEKLLQKFKK